MRALDLSSIGWEYVEIRGDDPRILHGEKLCSIRGKDTEGYISPDEDVLRALGFKGYAKQGLVYFVRVSPSRIENGEIKQLYGLQSLKGFFREGQNRIEPVQSKVISFSTAESLRPEDLMSSKDQKRGKRVIEMSPDEFKEAVMERRIPLSQIRRLHEVFNFEASLSETAMLSAIQQVRHAFNEDEGKEAIVISTFNGERFNPPIQIIRDDSFVSPTFYDIQDNYKVAEITVNSLGKADIQSASEAAHKEVRDALLAQAGIIKAQVTSSSVYKQTKEAQAVKTDATVDKPSSNQAPIAKKIEVPLISEQSFECALDDWVPSDFVQEEASESTAGEPQQRVDQAPQHSGTEDKLLTVAEFLKTKSVLSQIPKDILKTQSDWFAEYARGNPLIREETFLMSTRIFFREMIEAYWSKVDQKKPWFDPETPSAPINLSGGVQRTNTTAEVFESKVFSAPPVTAQTQSFEKRGMPQLPKSMGSTLVDSGLRGARLPENIPGVEEEIDNNTRDAASATPTPQNQTTGSAPKKGGFLGALKKTKPQQQDSLDDEQESSPEPVRQSVVQAADEARKQIVAEHLIKPRLGVPSVPRKPLSAATFLKI